MFQEENHSKIKFIKDRKVFIYIHIKLMYVLFVYILYKLNIQIPVYKLRVISILIFLLSTVNK